MDNKAILVAYFTRREYSYLKMEYRIPAILYPVWQEKDLDKRKIVLQTGMTQWGWANFKSHHPKEHLFFSMFASYTAPIFIWINTCLPTLSHISNLQALVVGCGSEYIRRFVVQPSSICELPKCGEIFPWKGKKRKEFANECTTVRQDTESLRKRSRGETGTSSYQSLRYCGVRQRECDYKCKYLQTFTPHVIIPLFPLLIKWNVR